MNLEESRAYLAERAKHGSCGLTWEQIAQMQRSGPLKRLNVQRQRAKGRPCVTCGKPSGSVGLLPLCKRCADPFANLGGGR